VADWAVDVDLRNSSICVGNSDYAACHGPITVSEMMKLCPYRVPHVRGGARDPVLTQIDHRIGDDISARFALFAGPDKGGFRDEL